MGAYRFRDAPALAVLNALERAGSYVVPTFLVSGFGYGAYSANLLAGTRRFSGFSQLRQCGELVLRMLVTGGPPVRGGGGIPQRIITISRSAPALRTTGAG